MGYRVGFVGTGQISAFHATALRRIANVELAGVYDIDPERCQRVAQSLNTRALPSVNAFRDESVDVIHVLTPPETHAELALEALELGAHVLVEKPLATDIEDCRRIAQAAQVYGLRVCVDHSLLYDHQIQSAIRAVRSGKIGRLISVEIFRSAEYPPYEGGRLPPHYRSAGFPFRDLGVHQLYLLQALLGPIEDVRAEWQSIGGDPNLKFDEWRIQVRCRNGSGHAQISFNARPIQNVITLHGTAGILKIDQMAMFSTQRIALPLPKTVERVVNAYSESLQTMVQVPRSTIGFLRKKIYQFDGVQRLIAEFYRCLDANLPVPVSVEDAIPVVDWVERVARAADADAAKECADSNTAGEIPILVTGAAGALGSAVVARLRECGLPFRAFVRRNASVIAGASEVVTGDLGDPSAVDRAARGARVVMHIGAATKGGWTAQHTATVVGTRNVIDACLKHGVDQLIYVSSMSVVDWAGAPSGSAITESSRLEPRPKERGYYTRAKLEAELLVREAVQKRGLRAVILRPGQIFGGKLPVVNSAVARRAGRYHLVLGDGTLRLPLVYIEDVVDAVLAAMDHRIVGGEVIQLVDSHLPTQNEILRWALNGRAKVVHVPRAAVITFAWLADTVLHILRRRSPIAPYRFRSALSRRSYASGEAERLLGWKPRVGVDAALAVSFRDGTSNT